MNVACVFAPCVVRADACCRRVFSQTVVAIDESQDLFVFALDPFSWIFQFFYWFAALFGFIHCSSTVTLHSWTLYLSFLLTDTENSNQKNQCSPGNVNKMMVNVSHSPVWSQFKAVVESFGVQTCVGLFTVRSSVSLKMNTKHVFMRKYWGALCPQSCPDWESQEYSTHYSSSFHYSHWLCADKTSETRAELDKQTVQRGKHRKKKTCIISKFRALKTDINYKLLDLTAHWLHDASIIGRLACDWLSREEEEERSLIGCCRLEGGHRSSYLLLQLSDGK